MKDSKLYSQRIRKLYRSLKRKYPKVKKVTYDNPITAVAYSALSRDMTISEANAVMKRFDEHFVGLNELRVSLVEEIIEVIGSRISRAPDIASSLIKSLGALFTAYNSLTLAPVQKIGKRGARKTLEKMNGFTPFMVDYLMLTVLGAHAIPLNDRIIKYLKENELVNENADEQDIQGFLARQISADNAYEFYMLLRRDSESSKRKAGKKTKVKKTSKTKTVKRKSKKTTPKRTRKTKKSKKTKRAKK